jgi:osmotically-inducible protein OsmY
MTEGNGRMGRAGILAVAAALLAVPGLAGSDADVQKKIEARLAKAGLDQCAEIRVEVENGIVRLSGVALSVTDARAIEEAARKEAKDVVSQVRVFPEGRSDVEVRKDAEKAVLGYARYGVFDAVGVGVKNGVVTLQGWVLQPWRSTDIEARVARVAGTRKIRNEIKVQPLSPMDDRLRHELYAKIYGDPMFERYAGWANPPIRIIVDHGHVTLAGAVASPVEQNLLGHIARGTLAFSVDNQVRLEGEPPKEDTKKEDKS